MQGFIIENISNLYQIKNENKVYEATARGKFKKDDITPVVGDFVQFEIVDEENKKAVITEIEERKVYIKRPKLANITQLIFVLSSKEPKPDLLMLDKQLAFAEFLNIKSVIIEKIGIEELKEAMQNEVNAFSGNSGVGKSTLINGIFKEDITQEGEISKKNKRGKNTTTAIKMYEIEKNTWIADTPGFSTFEIGEIDSKDLDKYFKEFQNELVNCEFIGCTHIKEQNCGIKKAVEEGRIDVGRYERFCKIYEELKEKERRKKW